jgi:putative addiction module component (TIGR02574 family)
MTIHAEMLLNDALRLPEHERAEFASRLLDSLDLNTDDDVDSAWAAEVEKRLAELDQGKVETIPWAMARGRIA